MLDESEIFLDPNKFSEDGTTAIRDQRFSHDGSILVYGLSEKGSDWLTLKVKFPNFFTAGLRIKLNCVKDFLNHIVKSCFNFKIWKIITYHNLTNNGIVLYHALSKLLEISYVLWVVGC